MQATGQRPTLNNRRPDVGQRGPLGLDLAELLPPLAALLLGLGLWEGLVRGLGLPPYLLPAPSAIAGAFGAQPGYLLRIGLYTFSEALGGFALGCGLGALGAAVCVRFRSLAEALIPFSVASNAIPIVALSPLLSIWLGSTTQASKVGVVTMMCFFPTLVNVYRGLVSPSSDTLALMRSYAANQRAVFLKLRVPAALPYLFNALKLCATLSMIGAVVAEFFGGQQNALGVYIKSQAGILRMNEAWSAIVVACLIGMMFYALVALVERRLIPWHVSFRSEAH